jgi:glucose/arabinose dehydrogenase
MFLDITAQVSSGGEAGLLGMAFHPDFGAGNFDVYVSYTRTAAPIESVVSRFSSTDNGLTLDPASEFIIMTIAQDESNHNGGQIGFGQDGFLYAGWGDGGGAGDPLERAQQTNNLLGSFTRIDVDSASPYAIPATNPFATNTNCMGGFGVDPCPEIFAYGLRNPWRWSFDSQTGIIWAGDVGQADWEEVNRIELSMNYGWDEREGAHCFEPATGCDTNNVDPVTEYSHGLGGSITGGYVYRGTAVPSLAGDYIFGDFVSGRIWSIPESSPLGSTATEIFTTTYSISAFAEDIDGEIYVIDYATGDIYQIIEQ